MASLREWILSICIAAVVASIVKIVAPSGSMQKMMRVVSSAFILCILLLPLIGNVTFDINEYWDNIAVPIANGGLAKQAVAQTFEYVEGRIGERVEASLKKIGIENAKVNIIMDTNGDGSISIIQADIYVCEKDMDKTPAARDYIQSWLGGYVQFTIKN